MEVEDISRFSLIRANGNRKYRGILTARQSPILAHQAGTRRKQPLQGYTAQLTVDS